MTDARGSGRTLRILLHTIVDISEGKNVVFVSHHWSAADYNRKWFLELLYAARIRDVNVSQHMIRISLPKPVTVWFTEERSFWREYQEGRYRGVRDLHIRMDHMVMERGKRGETFHPSQTTLT